MYGWTVCVQLGLMVVCAVSAATVGMRYRYVAATLTETVAANSAQPPAIVSPGKSLDDAEGAWPRTVVKYKGKLKV